MTRALRSLPLFLSVACASNTEPQLFFLNDLPPLEGTTETTCEENFDNAECPEPGEVDFGDWTYTNTLDQSNAQAFLEVYDFGPEDKAVVVFQGSAIEGVKEGKGDSFTFLGKREAFSDQAQTEDNSEGYIHETHSETTTIVELALNVEKGVLTADIRVSAQAISRVSETDEWDEEDTEVFSSREQFCSGLVPDDNNQDCTNSSDEAECEDDECFYQVTTESIGKTQFFGFLLDDAPEFMTVTSGQDSDEAGFGLYTAGR